MTVPEAAMDEDHGGMARKDDIRTARQVSAVKSESQSRGVQALPHLQLRLRIDLPDTGHVSAALLWSESIHQLRCSTDERRIP
jgi:hypothetical protein